MEKFADVSNFFADVSIFAELAILRINKHKTIINTLITLLLNAQKRRKTWQKCQKMAFGGHIEYFISKIKVNMHSYK